MSTRYFPLAAVAAAVGAAALFCGVAQAAPAPLTSLQMLQQFNVVVSGNLTSTSHVDGRTYVGGNVSGGDYEQHASSTPASNYAGLTVGGNASGNLHVNGLGAVIGGNVDGATVNTGSAYVGGNASNSSFNGDVWVAGNASGGNFNGKLHAASYTNINNLNADRLLTAPTAIMSSTQAAATSTNFGALMTGLSSQLSVLKATSGTAVTFSNNDHQVTLSGNGANTNGVVVFDLTSLDTKIFSSITTDISFSLSNATTVIFNTNDAILNLNANFNQAQSLGGEMIWNFAGATSVTVGRTFGGQVLVADGTFSNVGGANVEGGVFAKTLMQGGEIHLQSYSGVVPEPETYALMLGGLGLVGLMARRRRKGAAAV